MHFLIASILQIVDYYLDFIRIALISYKVFFSLFKNIKNIKLFLITVLFFYLILRTLTIIK